MLPLGRRKIRIKKYDDQHIKCENCGAYRQRFIIYQEYAHVLFIPFFPAGIKMARCVCLNCDYRLNEEKRSHYLSITKTPIYFYMGIILLIGLFSSAIVANRINQNQTRKFINEPKIGDVYRIRYDKDNKTTYYFMKINRMDNKDVFLLQSAFEYYGFTTIMNDSDFFVKNEEYIVSKTDLQSYLDSGYIKGVERNYDLDSRFNVEK